MQSDKNQDKVVSIFNGSKAKQESDLKTNSESFDFETIMRKNLENSGRQKKDREKSNRGVIRSYRLKH